MDLKNHQNQLKIKWVPLENEYFIFLMVFRDVHQNMFLMVF